jgi:prepilin peptidase CpaA
MIALIIFLTGVFVAIGAGVMASLSDIRGMVIANIYSGMVILSFVVTYALLWLLGEADVFSVPLSHILSLLIVFAITAGMFAARFIGAADSKLASAYALWIGFGGLPVFLVYMTLAGGVLAVVSLLIAKYRPFKNPRPLSWVARLQAGESKVPYGVAIAVGAVASFVKLGYLGPDMLSSFVGS